MYIGYSMRALKLRDFERYLKDSGCIPVKGTNAHVKWVNTNGTYQASIPSTHHEVSPGVIRNVYKALNIPKPK